MAEKISLQRTHLVSQPILAAIAKMALSSITRKFTSQNILPVDIKAARKKKFKASDARKVMKTIFVDDHLPIKKKVHVFYNFKGGTGKTSLCSQTAFFLHLMGFKVLTIDCDSQSHLSSVLGFPEGGVFNTMYDVLISGIPLKSAIYPIDEGFDAIPSNVGLTRIEFPLHQKTRREERMAESLKPLIDEDVYDFILIDTNPTISTLNTNALYAADYMNVVCETQPFSLQGLGVLVEEVKKMFADLRKPLNYSIIANKHESKTANAQEMLGALRKDYSKHMNQSLIRKSEDIVTASKKGEPVYMFASKASLALEDLIDYVHEFLAISRKEDYVFEQDITEKKELARAS